MGEILNGRYEVSSTHGRGVFSTVLRAQDVKAVGGREVAIKVRESVHIFERGVRAVVDGIA